MKEFIKYFKSGYILPKVLSYIRYTYNSVQRIMFISNKNTKEIALQDKVYRRLKRKYKSFVENYSPVYIEHKYENKIWICWLQGYENAPDLVKACINSIIHESQDFEVVVITENNISEYITLPNHIMNKYNEGMISRTHFSDVLRISILCEKGGIWIDSTVLCTNGKFLNSIAKYPLFVFKILDLTRKDTDSIVASSWFISSFSRSNILLLTRDLLYKYWEDYDYLLNYFVFHILFTIATERYSDEWRSMPMFENRAPHVLMFELGNRYSEQRWKQICRFSDIHKLTRHVEYSQSDLTNYEYIIKKFEKEIITK